MIPLGILGSSHFGAASYLQTAAIASLSSPRTLAAQNIGPASPTRYIIAAVLLADGSGGGTTAISSVTIGGVTATLVSGSSGGPVHRSAFYIAAVPTGTTANVVVTYTPTPGTVTALTVVLWRAESVTATTGQQGSTSVTITGYTRGSILAVATHPSGTMGGYSWTNATELFDPPAAGWPVGVAMSAAQSEAVGSTLITATHAGAGVQRVIAAAVQTA